VQLLTPVDLGPVTLPNRVVSTSHQTGLVHDHLPTPDLIAYHEARARGGVGGIFLEATAVDPSGLLTSHTLGGFLPEIVDGYEQLAGALHEHGTRLFVQLFHGGREQISPAPRAPTVAPSAVPSPRYMAEPRALTTAEIDAMLDGYATAARHCREGGVDGIEVSMSHGYLIAQFFSSASNRRDDAYAAPLRFAREVLAAVRDGAGPELAVGVRLSADELAPEGMDAAGCAEIAGELCAGGGIEFASFVLGHSAYFASSSWIVPLPPANPDALGAPLAAVRAAVDVPVIGTTQVVDVRAAERLIAGGDADAVGMTRALIADPELVSKAAHGRQAEVIACIGCNQGCIGHYHAGVPIGCVVNPRTGRERTLPRAAVRPRRDVLVIGGGPAGVAAALEAAESGAAVTLLEQGAAIGGQLRLAGRAPAHRVLWRRWQATAERRLERAGVDVRLDTPATAADADAAETVILATGARPYVPTWAAQARPGVAVVDAWTAIANPAAVAGPVLVADWGGGWDGLDAAETLAEQGVEVTLACAAPSPAWTLQQYQRNLYLARFDERGIPILHHTEVLGDRLRHLFSGREHRIPDVATLVVAHGRVPEDALWAELEERPGCARAGDVLGPRTAEEATLEGVTTLLAALA
jgi:2,4-dienoyl-CoA reductase-like NADH-dependent reductase (Old Yellow Enzyme family)/thioredoxin reductase